MAAIYGPWPGAGPNDAASATMPVAPAAPYTHAHATRCACIGVLRCCAGAGRGLSEAAVAEELAHQAHRRHSPGDALKMG